MAGEFPTETAAQSKPELPLLRSSKKDETAATAVSFCKHPGASWQRQFLLADFAPGHSRNTTVKFKDRTGNNNAP
jgi:hypothetical protein